MVEARREEDITRLARMEEQIEGIREDFKDFKGYMTNTVNAFMQSITTMQEGYMPRREIQKEFEIQDLARVDLEKRVAKLEEENKELRKRPSWLSVAVITLIGAAFGSLTLGLIELINHAATN